MGFSIRSRQLAAVPALLALVTAQIVAPLAHAEELSQVEVIQGAQDVESALNGVQAKIDAMSDEELSASMADAALQLESMSKDMTGLSDADRAQLSDASSQLLKDASDPSAKPRHKLGKVLKTIGKAIGTGITRSAHGYGYASAAVSQTISAPFRILVKFFRGIITGEAHPEYNHISYSVSGNASYALYIVLVFIFSPDPVTKAIGFSLLAMFSTLAADVMCSDKHWAPENTETARFCRNLMNIYKVGYKVTGAGDVAGAAIHNLFKKKH